MLILQRINQQLMASGGENYGKKGYALMWIGIALFLLLVLILYVYNMNFNNINPVG
jgi:isoprenylcysteine carboxyl methyltransferase (ICMT) family protein YpbQ